MHRVSRIANLAILAVVALGGCTLYFDHGDDQCNIADDVFVPPVQSLRNPETGQCTGVGGGGGCSDPCAPCPVANVLPNWGACFGPCDALDEDACVTTPRCRAAYFDDPTHDIPPKFLGCWSVAPSGPHTGTCNGLDAQACSEHDDCSAIYSAKLTGGEMFFEACTVEKGADACSATDCGPGSHCEQQCTAGSCAPMCVPDQTCAATTCPTGSQCVEVCAPPPPGCEPGTPGQCHAECQPTKTCEAAASESECLAIGTCTPIYLGDDCTCTPAGCTCAIETYNRCESK